MCCHNKPPTTQPKGVMDAVLFPALFAASKQGLGHPDVNTTCSPESVPGIDVPTVGKPEGSSGAFLTNQLQQNLASKSNAATQTECCS
jgi:hypothetical protein